MKKVVFFVTSVNSGGIENYLLRFLHFFEGKIDPIVICKGNILGELENNYLRLKNIELIKMDLGYFNLYSYAKLYSFLKEREVDVVCDFTGNFGGLVLLLSNLAAVNKRISFYRGSTNHFKESRVRLMYNQFMLWLVTQNATKILSNSKSALDYFYPGWETGADMFSVVYNGIPSEKFKFNVKKIRKEDFGIPKDAFVIGHTGRYHSSKNHDTIIKVAEKICAKYNHIFLMLCGKGTDLHLSEVISKSLVLKDKVKILGYRNDIENILPLFDLYFFPSVTEGQPNSLIEAMLSGLPIIASNIKPILETTPLSLHQELINPLDVESFCLRIEEYYLNEEKRKKNNFSDWAKENFSPEVLFNQFYNEL